MAVQSSAMTPIGTWADATDETEAARSKHMRKVETNLIPIPLPGAVTLRGARVRDPRETIRMIAGIGVEI